MFADLLQRLRFMRENTEFMSEDMKDFDKFQRMTERRAQRLAIMMEVEAYKAEREAELAQLAEEMSAMDYADAVAESFGGGPGNDNGNDGDDNA